MTNIPSPYKSLPYGDVLQTESLILRIKEIVLEYIANSSRQNISTHPELNQNFSQVISQVEIYAKAFDKIFNTPPIEENEIRRNGPSICLYNHIGELELVNKTYLQLVGIESSAEAKELVVQGKLIDRIYTKEVAMEVRKFVANIGVSGWYRGKIFPLRNGNAARWTSLSTEALRGNVRVAEDVSGIKEEDIPALLSLENVNDIPFLFAPSVNQLGILIERIMPLPTDMRISLMELQKISHIADIVVNKWPFFVVVKEGNTYVSVNKSYVAATGYSLEELLGNPKLYYADQEEQVDARIMSLQKRNDENDAFYEERKHYHDMFRMRRKDGAETNASWDTFRISNLEVNPMTTVRIGSMIVSAEEIEGERELQEWLRNNT